MNLHFNTIAEAGKPGPKWQKLFKTHWSAYRTWFESKGAAHTPDLKTSQEALKKYMPEMWPTYEKLCKLANADDVAARFLTGFQPPAYISGCSQAVLPGDKIKLVRNYDYHPDLTEGTQLLTAWNGKKVIATSDCLIGAVDGMNEDGLAVSLTFGGRKVVGEGFGIPFILRYVLEFSSNVEEAVGALTRIPSHMSYNVTVIDKSGAHKTVQLAPDKAPLVTDATFATNHQGTIDWPENAAFNKTVERYAFIKNMLSEGTLTSNEMADAFLKAPLYNTLFKEGFGTLYTVVYSPKEGTVQMRWPNEDILQNINDFKEEYRLIEFEQPSLNPVLEIQQTYTQTTNNVNQTYQDQQTTQPDWQDTVTDTLVKAMAHANPSADKKELETLRKNLIGRGQVSWEVLADFWSKMGTGYSNFWKN